VVHINMLKNTIEEDRSKFFFFLKHLPCVVYIHVARVAML
jgi:hypothetical protein